MMLRNLVAAAGMAVALAAGAPAPAAVAAQTVSASAQLELSFYYLYAGPPPVTDPGSMQFLDPAFTQLSLTVGDATASSSVTPSEVNSPPPPGDSGPGAHTLFIDIATSASATAHVGQYARGISLVSASHQPVLTMNVSEAVADLGVGVLYMPSPLVPDADTRNLVGMDIDIFQSIAGGPAQFYDTFGYHSGASFFRHHLPAVDGSYTFIIRDLQVFTQAGVPEPSVWAMMIIGLAGLGATLRRRRAGRPEPAHAPS